MASCQRSKMFRVGRITAQRKKYFSRIQIENDLLFYCSVIDYEKIRVNTISINSFLIIIVYALHYHNERATLVVPTTSDSSEDLL